MIPRIRFENQLEPPKFHKLCHSVLLLAALVTLRLDLYKQAKSKG